MSVHHKDDRNMRIDAFTHIYTTEYLRALRNDCPGIELKTDALTGKTTIVDRASGEVTNFLFANSAFDGLEERLAVMDRLKIDRQVLTAAQPTIDPTQLHVSNNKTIELAKIINDSMVKLVQGFEDRFILVAEIPTLEMAEALMETERAVQELGMKGIQLNTTIGGKPLDSPEFRPIFAKATKLNIPILIHPCNVAKYERRNYETQYGLHRILGWPFETSLAMARLVFGGILSEYPSLKIVTHHTGGMIPFFANRIESFYARELAKILSIAKGPKEYFGKIFYDTATEGNVPALNCASDMFGSERLVFGTDYPFRNVSEVHSIIEAVSKMDVTEEEREAIFGGNASDLFRL